MLLKIISAIVGCGCLQVFLMVLAFLATVYHLTSRQQHRGLVNRVKGILMNLKHTARHESKTKSEDIVSTEAGGISPISVNYHFTRKCNKECGFCFHTEKTSFVATEQDMKKGMQLLKHAGMRKINFAGGEPFLYPKKLATLCRFAKQSLKLESVSIITNGTKVTERWLAENADCVDILGVSCDSFDESTNIAIGRGTGQNVSQLFRIRNWCQILGIKFKLNTVVCRMNWEEDMSSIVCELNPFRWKCFQVLLVQSENDAADHSVKIDKRKRNAQKFLISSQQYEAFCRKHRHLKSFVAESNDLMASSYLILDEYLCFLDKGNGRERQSSSILTVGVYNAMKEIRWDQDAFFSRGGVYDWSQDQTQCGSELPEALQF